MTATNAIIEELIALMSYGALVLFEPGPSGRNYFTINVAWDIQAARYEGHVSIASHAPDLDQVVAAELNNFRREIEHHLAGSGVAASKYTSNPFQMPGGPAPAPGDPWPGQPPTEKLAESWRDRPSML